MLHCYIAASLDGYVASPDGGVDWLKPFETEDYGYQRFIAGITTLVMGRHTYEQALSFGDWPYKGRDTLVVTSHPLDAATMPDRVTARPADFVTLAQELRGRTGDSWLVGGPGCLHGFMQHGAVDRPELYVIPILLGNGIPLFPKADAPYRMLHLRQQSSFSNGVQRLVYDFA